MSHLDRRNNLGAVPDREEETDEYFGKLTANPMSNHFLAASARSRETDDQERRHRLHHPSDGGHRRLDGLPAGHRSPGPGTSRPNSLVELKLNHNKEENSGVPITDLGYRPAFNAARPDLVGSVHHDRGPHHRRRHRRGPVRGRRQPGFNFQDFKRDEARLTYQQFASPGRATRHDLRAGVTYDENEERLERLANGWGSITWSATTQRVHGDLQLHAAAAHRPRRDLGRLPPGPDRRSASG